MTPTPTTAPTVEGLMRMVDKYVDYCRANINGPDRKIDVTFEKVRAYAERLATPALTEDEAIVVKATREAMNMICRRLDKTCSNLNHCFANGQCGESALTVGQQEAMEALDWLDYSHKGYAVEQRKTLRAFILQSTPTAAPAALPTQSQIDNGPHAGLSNRPSDYAPAVPPLTEEPKKLVSLANEIYKIAADIEAHSIGAAAAPVVKYVPVDYRLRNEARSSHPNDDEPCTPECRAALNERGDDKGQGLDGYWKWGFRAGFNACLAASKATATATPPDPDKCTAWVKTYNGYITSMSCTTGRSLIDKGGSDGERDYYECPDCGKAITIDYRET